MERLLALTDIVVLCCCALCYPDAFSFVDSGPCVMLCIGHHLRWVTCLYPVGFVMHRGQAVSFHLLHTFLFCTYHALCPLAHINWGQGSCYMLVTLLHVSIVSILCWTQRFSIFLKMMKCIKSKRSFLIRNRNISFYFNSYKLLPSLHDSGILLRIYGIHRTLFKTSGYICRYIVCVFIGSKTKCHRVLANLFLCWTPNSWR